MRSCKCGRIFHLFNEGVQLGVDEPKTPTEKSGVIPVPCREREWKPLVRNPFEHMRLAMVTR